MFGWVKFDGGTWGLSPFSTFGPKLKPKLRLCLVQNQSTVLFVALRLTSATWPAVGC